MATFKEIRGQTIKKYTTNPTNPLEGQMWYNNTTGTLKGSIISEAWSSSAPIINSEGITYAAGAGTQTAGLFFGGNDNPSGNRRDETWEYNGSGWAVGGSLTAPWYLGGGMGTQTAALQAFGSVGSPVTEAFEYDGSTWTAAGDGNTGRYAVGSAGSQTAGLCFGGVSTPPTTWHALTESYNGTGWSVENTLTTARNQSGFLGDASTSALCIGGETPPSWATIANVEEWGGTSWTAGTAFPAATQLGVGTGSVTAGLYYGTAPDNAEAFTYDGTTWTASANLATGRNSGVRCGTGTSAALLASGSAPTALVLTEEFNRTGSVITGAAWAAGDNMPESLGGNTGAGTLTAGLSMGGFTGTAYPGKAYEYNGTSWAAGNADPALKQAGAGCGTQTAALFYGGGPGGPPAEAATYEYDGTNWTAGGALPAGVYQPGGFGTQTAAVSAGGDRDTTPDRYPTASNEYNGTAWTAGNSISQARSEGKGGGIAQTAGIYMGGTGQPSPGSEIATTEEYDGTNWTSGGNMLKVNRSFSSGALGPSSDAMIAGGTPGSGYYASSEKYNGTNWATAPSITTARQSLGMFGNGSDSSSGAVCGGATPSKTNATEEFTGETTAANIVTVTTS